MAMGWRCSSFWTGDEFSMIQGMMMIVYFSSWSVFSRKRTRCCCFAEKNAFPFQRQHQARLVVLSMVLQKRSHSTSSSLSHEIDHFPPMARLSVFLQAAYQLATEHELSFRQWLCIVVKVGDLGFEHIVVEHTSQ